MSVTLQTVSTDHTEKGSLQINTSFIVLVSVVAALGGLLFGFDTAIISGTIPYIKDYFLLDEFGLGWAVGSILIGCAAGAFFAGKIADMYGRRAVLIVCAVLFAASGIGAGLASHLFVFVFFRIIGGLGVGAAAMVSPMYIAEIAPSSLRGRLVALYQLAIVSGILLAYFSNYLLDGAGENNWRYMFASQAIPSLIFFILLLIVPESPRWLVKKNKIAKAFDVIAKVNGREAAGNGILAIQKTFLNENKVALGELFESRYARVLWIGIAIAVFQQITGVNAILYYAPVIFKETGLDTSSSLLQTIIIGVVNVCSTFIAIGLVDKVGRRKFLLAGSIIMGLSLISIAICFRIKFFDDYIVLISMLLYIASFGCTLGAVTWVYLSEIFPNRIRALAMSAATLALWLADFLVTYTFPIITKHLGTSASMMIYAVCCIAAFLFIWKKVPETKGKTLEEMESLFT